MKTFQALLEVVSHFVERNNVADIVPLGNGLINDTFKVMMKGDEKPRFVLQRINNAVFTDVEMLQRNIGLVTQHLRDKGILTLQFLTADTGKTYVVVDGLYWRVMNYVPDSYTYEAVTPEYARCAGYKFGEFETQLVDLKEPIGEIIPDFHNIEFRLKQLDEAIAVNPVGRISQPEVQSFVQKIKAVSHEMCAGERLCREGKLPKRICHCDTKVNNMLFDKDGNVLCIIDLDTVMPSFIFSDFGDFLRSAANTGAEDDADLNHIHYDMAIFEAFAQAYLEGTKSFLLPVEKEHLPYAAMLFPYMQTVRFLADYINGDTYYKIKYPEHNLVRTRAQWKLFEEARAKRDQMKRIVENF